MGTPQVIRNICNHKNINSTGALNAKTAFTSLAPLGIRAQACSNSLVVVFILDTVVTTKWLGPLAEVGCLLLLDLRQSRLLCSLVL